MAFKRHAAILGKLLYGGDPEKVAAKAKSGRLEEIDFAKGIAGFLMVLAHLAGSHLWPHAGTFGAPLFFCCSGMNTYLFLKSTEKIKRIGLINIAFPVILFFGGYTQIVISHRKSSLFIPEFLQLSGLAILAIFLVFKWIKKPAVIGALFIMPFLLNAILPADAISFLPPRAGAFILWRGGFSLIPWSGYFFYGIFLMAFRKRPRILLAVIACQALLLTLCAAILRIPVVKFSHSLSYIFLALMVLASIYTASLLLVPWMRIRGFRMISGSLSLAGRNSLMFLYVHYLVLRYFMPEDLAPSLMASLLLGSVVVFAICVFLLRFYETVKLNFTLFLPAAAFLILLVVFRLGNLFNWNIANALLVDMTIGILFAFLYVQGRAIARKYLLELSMDR